MNYAKEDLLWEATRRNENYKKGYYKIRGDQQGEVERWEKIWDPCTNYKWRISGAIDPTISIDEIKKKIENGADPFKVHPYYKKYRDKKKVVIQHKLPYLLKNIRNGLPNATRLIDENYYDETLNRWIQELVSDWENKILVSINIDSNDEEIFKNIKRIKNNLNRRSKDEKIKDDNLRPLSPTKIKSYIGWLRKYDEMVEEFLKEFQKSELISPEGFIEIPPKRDFQEFAPVEGRRFESDLKSYRRAYAESVNLIKVTPNIVFIPARIEK